MKLDTQNAALLLELEARHEEGVLRGLIRNPRVSGDAIAESVVLVKALRRRARDLTTEAKLERKYCRKRESR